MLDLRYNEFIYTTQLATMNIELLHGILPISEHPGLNSTDPRFDEIATLVQDGNYAEAAHLSQIAITDGIYDIRLICYFLYGTWHNQSLNNLINIINSLNNLLRENWTAVGPAKKREKSFQTALNWLFRQILKKLQFEEKKHTPLWQQWRAATTPHDVDLMVAAGDTFRVLVEQRLENEAAATLNVWSKVISWLESFQARLDRVPEPTQGEQVEQSVPESPESVSNKTVPALSVGSHELALEVSYHMSLLLKKLAAFEWLLAEKKFPQAALVADDLNQTLASFDPMVYFPKTFEAFVRLQVIHFEALSEYEGHRGSPQWQAMQDWLKIDLDSFINN